MTAALCIAGSLGLGCDDEDDGSDDSASGPASDGVDDAGDEEDDDEGGEGEGEESEGGGDDQAGEEGGEADNVAACESLLDALECGGFDFTQVVACDSYANLTCDLVDYFTCLEDNFTCTDGVFDPTGWMMCADLATCE